MFKEALRGFLPQEIIAKQKHGMGVPVGVWINSHPELASLVQETVLSGNALIHEYIQPKFLEYIWQKMKTESTPYYGDNLWVFLILELWMEGRP
jgi:asparagine synthase (glutamine-hydrolysing)